VRALLVVGAEERAQLLAPGALEAEGVVEGRGRQAPVLAVGPGGRARALQEGVERGPVVEAQDAGAVALDDDERLADAAPAVADPDPDRRVRADGDADDGLREDLVPCSWRVSRIAKSSPAQPPTSKHGGAGDAIGAAHHVEAVAGEALAEEQEQAASWPMPTHRRGAAPFAADAMAV
jgi:hypothetical protein